MNQSVADHILHMYMWVLGLGRGLRLLVSYMDNHLRYDSCLLVETYYNLGIDIFDYIKLYFLFHDMFHIDRLYQFQHLVVVRKHDMRAHEKGI